MCMYDSDKDQAIVLRHATVIAVVVARYNKMSTRETDRPTCDATLRGNSEDCSSVVGSIILMVRFMNGNGALRLSATATSEKTSP